jgi:dienelactone hydrolase
MTKRTLLAGLSPKKGTQTCRRALRFGYDVFMPQVFAFQGTPVEEALGTMFP